MSRLTSLGGVCGALLCIGLLALSLPAVRVAAKGPAAASLQQGCDFHVTPTRVEVGAGGQTGTVQVTVEPGCGWTVDSDVSWMQVSVAGGTGSGSISYTVAPAPPFAANLRQGRIRVRWNTPTAGQNVLVTQTFTPCEALMFPPTGPTSATTFGALGGGGHIDVDADLPASRPWLFRSAPSWITFTSPPLGVAGSGNGAAFFVVSPNTTGATREGTITFCNSNTINVRQTGRLRVGPYVPGDFDDDGIADPAVYRPSTGMWFVLLSSNGYSYANHLNLTAAARETAHLPAPGDYDGDARTDFAGKFSGLWFTRYSSDGYGQSTKTFAQVSTFPDSSVDPGDTAVTLDINGDGKNDFALFRPSTGMWYVTQGSIGDLGTFALRAPVQWGLPGDVPAPGDFDGDRISDIAVWRPSNGLWFILFSSRNFDRAAPGVIQWGLPGDIPLPAFDFDRDGRSDPAIWRPSDGTWWILPSSAGYQTWRVFQWGLTGDVPVPKDFDGDGAIDLAVWRPANGTWYILPSTGQFSYGTARMIQWGLPGDVPIK